MNKVKHIKLVSFDAFDTLVTIKRNKWLQTAISKVNTGETVFNPQLLRQRLLCENTPAVEILKSMQLITEDAIPEITDLIAEEIKSIQAVPYHLEIIGELCSSYKLAVISNLGQDYGKAALHAIGAQLDHVIFSYEIGHVKPAPAIFEKLIADSGLEPYQIVHIGNSYANDYLGAKNAGMHAIHLDLFKENKTAYSINELTSVLNFL